MDSSRRVTSIFIAVALLALAALAINVNHQKSSAADPDMSVLPGLAENLRSIAHITGYPYENFRVVKVMRSNGDEISVVRKNIEAGFEFRSAPPPSDTDKAAYSAILYANAAFLDELSSEDSVVVTGSEPEQQIGRLVYTSFDGLVLENTVFRAGNASWLKMTAGYSDKLAATNLEGERGKLMSANEVKDVVTRLQGRIYKMPDHQQQ
jgi:hypothetical protein